LANYQLHICQPFDNFKTVLKTSKFVIFSDHSLVAWISVKPYLLIG